jgi:hypothetical protein
MSRSGSGSTVSASSAVGSRIALRAVSIGRRHSIHQVVTASPSDQAPSNWNARQVEAGGLEPVEVGAIELAAALPL